MSNPLGTRNATNRLYIPLDSPSKHDRIQITSAHQSVEPRKRKYTSD